MLLGVTEIILVKYFVTGLFEIPVQFSPSAGHNNGKITLVVEDANLDYALFGLLDLEGVEMAVSPGHVILAGRVQIPKKNESRRPGCGPRMWERSQNSIFKCRITTLKGCRSVFMVARLLNSGKV